MNWFEQGGPLALVVWLNQHLGPSCEGIVRGFHLAGQGVFYLLILAPLYWVVDPRLGRRLAVRFMLSACLNSWVKSLFMRPRPFEQSAYIRPIVTEHSPGIPSGHAQHAVTVWGSLARWLRRRWLTVGVVVFCLSMGLSRMVAGVHYPQDVLTGWLLGLGLIVASERAEARWLPALRAAGPRRQVEIAAGAVLLAALLTRLLAARRGAGLQEAAAPLGMMLGLLFGIIWERAQLRFQPPAGVPARVLGAVLGLATLLGLQAALVHRGQPIGLAFLAHVVLGLWLAVGVPALLVRVRLADSAPREEPQ
ncbi:MAG: phosphatase PAP2 family protein [Armatimonadetes bacterium]|nr:phosphatase PAP2 family protein [Armatimonadota bacterium]